MLWILVSRIADFIAILGVPALWITTRRFYAEFRKDQAARRAVQIVSQGCLEFSDDQAGINLIPLDKVTVVPRPGDTVILPGETHDGTNYGAGVYDIESVSFSYSEAPEVDQPCPAKPSKVIARVRRRER